MGGNRRSPPNEIRPQFNHHPHSLTTGLYPMNMQISGGFLSRAMGIYFNEILISLLHFRTPTRSQRTAAQSPQQLQGLSVESGSEGV